jgi:hypothetical protein
MSIFTNEQREMLEMVYSRKTFVKISQCMVCGSETKPVNCTSFMLPFALGTPLANMLIYCGDCEQKVKYVYIRECISLKKLPIKTPLFHSDIEFKVIRTNGSESVGQLEPHLNLGWSASANEITVWVKLDGTETTKPLTLSLLFEANPQLRDLPEFAKGLVLRFEYEDILKAEFPDFFNQVQTSVDKLNDRFFSDRV